MTVSTSLNRADYIGNGATTLFVVPFYFPDQTNLQVLSTVIATGVSTVLVLNSDYTVAGAGVSTGGSITMSVAPASTVKITVLLNLAFVQTTHYVPNDPFPAASHEAALDYLTLLDKQTEEQVSRAIQVPAGESGTVVTLPPAATRAGFLLGFDGAGGLALIAAAAQSATALATSLLSNIGSTLVAFLQAGTGAVLRTVQDKLRDTISVKDFGAKGDGVTNDTAAIQAAMTAGGVGSTIYFPPGIYLVYSSLTRQPGQTLRGSGWQDKPATFQFMAGSTEIRLMTAGVVLISSSAASDAVNAGRGGLKDIALTFQGGSATSTGDTTSTGFYAKNNRQLRLENAAFSGFGTGYELADNCWQSRLDQVLVFDAVVCAYTHDAGGEDSTHINCIYRGYRATSQGVHLKNQVQRVTMIGCDTSNNQLGIFMEQGDTNGDGTGTPYPMGLTNIGGQFENCTAAGIRSVSSALSTASATIAAFPSITVIDPRAFISTSPNTGQILIDAQKASRVELTGTASSGYSVGVQIGATGATPVVAEVHLNNPQAVWGTAEVACTTPNGLAKIFRRTGPRPSCNLTATSLAYVSGNFTRVPFTVVGSDTETWTDTVDVAIRPRRAVRTRFVAQVDCLAAPVGRYLLILYKNGSILRTLFDLTISTGGNPVMMQGEGVDTPNGSTDYYHIGIFSTASFSIDTTNCNYYAESCL